MSQYTDDWHRLYGESWKGAIEDDAFVHPAKFSRALIRAIYDHALDEGWLCPGDTVVDPFGGVALGAMDAMRCGLHWVGMELEERFVLLGNRNIERWEGLFRATGRAYGGAYLYHGDSRYLALLLARRANGCVSSPPYAGGCAHTGGDDPHPEHVQGGTYHGVGLQGAISSPPYAGSTMDSAEYEQRMARLCAQPLESLAPRWQREVRKYQRLKRATSLCQITTAGYGSSSGQLGAMPEGQLDACISSPPFGESTQSRDGDFTLHSTDANPTARRLDTRSYFPAEMDTPGQLGQMSGGFDGAISSPPYEATRVVDGETMRGAINEIPEHIDSYSVGSTRSTIGSIDTFWSAARQIVEQVHQILAPGAVSIWVCKDFVRDGERVPFAHQWARLCEACGFEWLHEHRAWVVEDYGTQLGLFEDVALIKERKSFFRRLAERKGSPRIDWESVLCLRKPGP